MSDLRALADSIISDVQGRVVVSLGNSSTTSYRFGVVENVSGKSCSVRFEGCPQPVPSVRVPSNAFVFRGSYVRVAMSQHGDSFVTEVY